MSGLQWNERSWRIRVPSPAVPTLAAAILLCGGARFAFASSQSIAVPASFAQSSPSPDLEPSLIAAARQNPGDFTAQMRLGEFYLQHGRLPDGIHYLEIAQRLNPQDYDSGYDLALACLDEGDLPKASAQIEAMIRRNETAELDSLLAEVYEKSGDYKNAAVTYDRAAQLQPSEDNIFDVASFLLQHPRYEGFLDKALAFFKYGAQRYPQSAKLAVGLGVALYAEGKYDEAVGVLCGAVDLDPADPKPYQFLGKVGKVSPALLPRIRERLAKYVELYPDNGSANYYYAMVLRQLPEGDPAADPKTIQALLQKAVSVEPDLYEAHFQLGALYQEQNRYADAIAEFSRTLAIRPDYNRAHYRLVLLYNRTHQKELADQQLALLKQVKAQDEQAEELEDNPEGAHPPAASPRAN